MFGSENGGTTMTKASMILTAATLAVLAGSAALPAQAALNSNGLNSNGLGANALNPNGLIANGLIANGLTPNGLGSNALNPNALAATGAALDELDGVRVEAVTLP